ncbi:XRE family transcriptional regulator [Streptomyces sp. NPDC002692]
MTDLIRKGEGKPLRAAMRRNGLTQAALADKTKAIDTERGRGVSLGTVIKVTGRGKYASDRCRRRTAELITAALDEPLDAHFLMPADATHTVERC